MNKFTLFISAFFAANQLVAQCIPQLNCPPAPPVSLCDETTNDPKIWNASFWWDATISSHDMADAPVDLSVTATDDCSNGDFTFTCLLFLDLDGDGTQETVVNPETSGPPGAVRFGNANNPNYTGGTVRLFDQRNVPWWFRYRFALQTETNGASQTAHLRWRTHGIGNTFSAPQLPYGTHRIRWTVTNSVGNTAVCEYNFEVKDCKAPTVMCINGLSVNIMPTGMITLWGADLLQYAADNYTPIGQLQYGFSKADVTSFPMDAFGNPITSLTFTCNDLGMNMLKLWVRDLTGNTGYCETSIDIQDNNSNCTGNPFVSGCAKTACSNAGLEDVSFMLSGTPPPGLPPLNIASLSNFNGCANLGPVSPDYVNTYFVAPFKDDNPLNGVSSYDKILIIKHINGTQPFTHPIQWVAADTDQNGVIDTFDIILIDQVIWGIQNGFPNGESWRFYRSDYVFPPGDPLSQPIPSSASVADLLADPDLGFKAVKIGDVNCTALPNSFAAPPEKRQAQASATTVIFPPQPNPTTAGAAIPIRLAAPENVRTEVRDLSGKLLWLKELPLEGGDHLLEIPASAFPQAGMYIWRVMAGAAAQSGKLVRM